MMNVKKNQIFEAKVSDMNIMGYGVAKINGIVFFIQNAVLDEEVKIRVIKVAKNYCVARVEEVLVPSPFRIDPACSIHRRCGGCNFQHIDYELEKQIKQSYVQSCFLKAGLNSVKVLPVLSTGETCHYRNKAQYPVSRDKNGNIVCGFYSTKTHVVQPVAHCSIQNSLFSDIVAYLCEFFTKHNLEPYCEEDESGLVRHVYLRSADSCGDIMLCLVLSEDNATFEKDLVAEITSRFPAIKSIYFNINSDQTNVVLGNVWRLIWGSERIRDRLCGVELDISPNSFYQVNRKATELLYQTAFHMAQISEHDLVLDLYCGIGSISLTASANSKTNRIVGVEIVPEAVEDAKRNAALNGIDNAKFICCDAKDAFSGISEMKAKNPLIVVDPPRKGLSKELVLDLSEQGFEKILYISCGPDTLARDVALFSENGYAFDFVQPVDLFPRTGHIESIVVLSRSGN